MNSRIRLAFVAFVAVGMCALGIVVNAGANHSQTDLLSIGPNGGNGAFDASLRRTIRRRLARVLHHGREPGQRRHRQLCRRLRARREHDHADLDRPINGNGAFDASFAGATPDGTHVFFETNEKLTSTDTDTAQDVYERFGGTTTEVSIGPAGGNSAIDSFYAGISTDGARVFFVSYDKLTSDDLDTGRKDVYERSGGTVTLVSAGGNGAFGAEFDGASADGTRVFFHTDESLVGADTDSVARRLRALRGDDDARLDRTDQRQRSLRAPVQGNLAGREPWSSS